MIDINSFLLVIVCLLSSILLVVLIVLGIKLINTVNKFDSVLDEVNIKLKKVDGVFDVMDTITDSVSLVSDKLVDTVAFLIRKIFQKKNRKEDDMYE